MDFIKHIKTPEESLKHHIHRRLPTSQDTRSIKTLHASDITKEDPEFCPREFAIMDIIKKEKKGMYIGTAMRATFDVGEAVHTLVREKWADDIAIGTWKCRMCHHEHKFSLRPHKCNHNGCHSKKFDYHEEVFWSSEGHYVSSIDMLVKFESKNKLTPVEIKSIDKDKFKELVAPLAEHRLRTNLYLRSILNSNHPHRGRIDTDKGMIIYVCKGFGFKDTSLKDNGISDAPFSPFKEFYVSRKDKTTQYLIDRALQLDDFRRGAGELPTQIHPSIMSKRCSKCNHAALCWSGTLEEKLNQKKAIDKTTNI